MERAELYQKIAGCLMAGALGDALGYEVEFISWDAIRRRFGEGGIQNLVPEWFGRLGKYVYVPLALIVFVLGIVYGGIG